MQIEQEQPRQPLSVPAELAQRKRAELLSKLETIALGVWINETKNGLGQDEYATEESRFEAFRAVLSAWSANAYEPDVENEARLRFRDEQRPPKPLYVELAESVGAVIRCRAAPGQYGDWESRHASRLETATKDYMPSGSGFDSGTTIDLDASTADKLVFSTSYHHMNDVGMYDGWTEHDVIVTPDLASGFKLRITGRDRNGIKEYIAETFDSALRQPVNRLGLDEKKPG
jgi:hypothetical protein